MNNDIAVPEAIEGRVLDLRGILRTAPTTDPVRAEVAKAFARIANKEHRIDVLAEERALHSGAGSRETYTARIEELRAEIRAQYEDMIEKADIQIALRDRGLL